VRYRINRMRTEEIMRGRASLALTIMLLLTACGAGGKAWTEAGASSAGPEPVLAESGGTAGGEAAIVAKDLAFEPKQVAVTAGAVELTLTNQGVALHTLVFDGPPKFDKLETGQGEAARATMNLPPGTYAFYCDQPGHRGAGMEGTLVVT
jgi:plastocyanin